MKEKILKNLQGGRYERCLPCRSCLAYVNRSGGWTDYLLADKIVFSHRVNDFTCSELSEKLHAHEYYELTIPLTEGGVEYLSDDRSVLVRRGTVILSKPMQFHMFRLSESVRYDRYVIYFRDTEGLFPDKAVFDLLKMGSIGGAVFELPEQMLLSYLAEAEAALSDTASGYSCARALLRICELLLALSGQSAVTEEGALPSVPVFLCEIKKYVDENFLKIQSVEDLARQFFYSREYISRSFRKYYNTPIYEYILQRKLQHSALLLRQGASVETCARAAGFVNMSSFIKLFRKMNRCTPSEYRRRALKLTSSPST